MRGPTLPVNIVKIIINLPVVEREGVMPRVSPTVPNADIDSNNIGMNSKGSVIQSKVVVTTTVPKDSNIITKARFKKSSGRVFLKTFISSCPFKTLLINKKAVAKVVVLIPPPVDPGDAPINISEMSKNWDASVIELIFIVLNPAVLAEALWKKDDATLSVIV